MRLRPLRKGHCPTGAGIFEGERGGWLWEYGKKLERGTNVIGTNCCCWGEGPLESNSGQTGNK